MTCKEVTTEKVIGISDTHQGSPSERIIGNPTTTK